MAAHFDLDEVRLQLRALAARLATKDARATSADFSAAVDLCARLMDRLDRLGTEQSRLEQRVARIENSLWFRSMRKIGLGLRTWRLKFREKFLDAPFTPIDPSSALEPDWAYESWFAEQEQQAASWEWHRQQAGRWLNQPLISVVMAAGSPDRARLEAAVKSITLQSYPQWELCVCANASPDWLAEFLAVQAAAQDTAEPRLRYHLSPAPLGICDAWNQAARLARGEYLAFLDADAVLSPLALHYVAEQVRDEPADIVYSDEDFLNADGRRGQPLLKPDWSPDLLMSCMYLGHLLVIARQRWEEIGGFRGEYDGAQEYDAALRITDRCTRVRHVPRVLYHSRPSSPANAAETGRLALEEAVQRRGLNAQVTAIPGTRTYHLHRRVAGNPSVGFVICSRNRRLLARCLKSVQPVRSRHDVHFVVVHHQNGGEDGIPELIRQYEGDRVPFREPFNFSRMNNLGAAASRGDVLFFLNDDVAAFAGDWLDHLLAHLERPEVGIVGAKLLYASGAIQHAGVVLGMSEAAGHAGRGTYRSERWRWMDQTRDVSAVTGACMGIRRRVFTEAGGFDLRFPLNYNDIDLCLRVRQHGYRVIYEPHAVLRHDEGQTRVTGTMLSERERFHDAWSSFLAVPDPYYSPLLAVDSEKIELRFKTGTPSYYRGA
jgi:O-antigen biosynthesis protein